MTNRVFFNRMRSMFQYHLFYMVMSFTFVVGVFLCGYRLGANGFSLVLTFWGMLLDISAATLTLASLYGMLAYVKRKC